MAYTTYNLDCREVMDLYLDDNSVDAIVTDPPYGLSFMGRHWDHGVPGVEFWERAFRVLKPGGHLLAFGGPRTYHRLTCAIEDAGFEIKDSCMWLFSQGFPKSLNISKAIDKAAGAEREVIRTEKNFGVTTAKDGKQAYGDYAGEWDVTATDAAKQWEGWGSALKPAHEPICVARKPFPGTLANNVLQWGVGGLNIDACRIGTETIKTRGGDKFPGVYGTYAECQESFHQGRWPANVIHDGSDEVLALFPDSKSGADKEKVNGDVYAGGWADRKGGQQAPSEGSAARYFYQVKPESEPCAYQNQIQKTVSIAELNLSLSKNLDAIALVRAVNAELPEGLRCLDHLEGLSMTATQNELKQICDSAMQVIQSIAKRLWLGLLPIKLFLSLNHASAAVTRDQTGITMITISLLKLDGFVGPVTFSITQKNSEVGEKDYGISNSNRYMYCAKASKADREEGLDNAPQKTAGVGDERPSGSFNERLGKTPTAPRANHHPTVKPTDLMAYLCRLVTPPGGVVLDPFMGSGSTGKAALREGFRFIGCELEAEYHAIAQARLKAAL